MPLGSASGSSPAVHLSRVLVMQPSLRALLTVVALSIPARAAQIQGEPPTDPSVSNWPHPAAPLANPFPRDGEPGVEYRDAKIRLGKVLFWEEQVASDNSMACGTCHFPEFGGTDPRPGALHANGNLGVLGVVRQSRVGGDGPVVYGNDDKPDIDRRVTPRAAPTVIGAYAFENLNWNASVKSTFTDESGQPFLVNGVNVFGGYAALENLAATPPLSAIEMGHAKRAWSDVKAKLDPAHPLMLVDPNTVPRDIRHLTQSGKTYRELFDDVFARDPLFGGELGVTRERFAMAVAHYVRTLVPDQAPIDVGDCPPGAADGANCLTPNQRAGFEFLISKGCLSCHSDGGLAGLDADGTISDWRDQLLSNGRPEFNGASPVKAKVPTLRNLGLKNRFFSTGLTGGHPPTPAGLIAFYEHDAPPTVFVGVLTATEKRALEGVLFHALTDPRVAQALPPFDRPTLFMEQIGFDQFEGNEFGAGTSNGVSVPEIIAYSPAVVPPNASTPSHFKIGVGRAAPNELALLFRSGTAGDGTLFGGVAVWLALNELRLVKVTTTDAGGIATAHIDIAPEPSLVGSSAFWQWSFGDGSASDAAETVFYPAPRLARDEAVAGSLVSDISR